MTRTWLIWNNVRVCSVASPVALPVVCSGAPSVLSVAVAAAAALEAVLNSIEPEYCLGYFGWSLVLILEPLKIHYFPVDREGEPSFQAFST